MASALTRVISRIFSKAEGDTITGPLARVARPEQGWIPMSWPLNFWQNGWNVLKFGDSCSIVEACVWAYVRAIAQLPGYHRELLDNDGVETIDTSALSRLLRFPNSYQTSADFLTHVVRSLLFDGNSYSLAIRNNRNEVVELHWLNSRQCRAFEVLIEDEKTKEVFYSIGNNNQVLNLSAITKASIVPARDILHVKLATPNDPLIGESPLSQLAFDLSTRSTVAMGMSSYFNNASRPSGVLQTALNLTRAEIDELRGLWNEQAQGMSAGGVPILTRGLSWHPMGLSNQDAQLVEYLKLSDVAICGVFGVPPVLVGINSQGQTFSSTEALMNYWLANGLGDLLNRIETAIDQFIGLPAREYVEYDVDALLRADLVTRIDALTKGVQGGIFAPNEARAREGYKRVKAGDEPRVQQQVVPLSFAAEPPRPPATGSAGGVPPAPPAAGVEPAPPAQPAKPAAAKEAEALPPPDPDLSVEEYEQLLEAA